MTAARSARRSAPDSAGSGVATGVAERVGVTGAAGAAARSGIAVVSLDVRVGRSIWWIGDLILGSLAPRATGRAMPVRADGRWRPRWTDDDGDWLVAGPQTVLRIVLRADSEYG